MNRGPAFSGRNKRRGNGFTLVELLLVTAIFPVVALAIYVNFSAGTRLWSALRENVPREDLALFYQKSSRDFENMFKYKTIPFEADESEVTFATQAALPPELGADRGIVSARYFYDSEVDAIIKEEKNLHDLHKDKPGRKIRMLAPVYSLKIYYFLKNVQYDRYEWAEEWTGKEEALPLALRFEFEYGAARERVVKTFPVPAGG